jgi:hypothetical protein
MLNLQLWATSSFHRFNNALFGIGAKPEAITELTTQLFLAKNYSVNLGVAGGAAVGGAIAKSQEVDLESGCGLVLIGAGLGYIAGHIAGVEIAIRNIKSLQMKNEISPRQCRLLQVISLVEQIAIVTLALGFLAHKASR